MSVCGCFAIRRIISDFWSAWVKESMSWVSVSIFFCLMANHFHLMLEAPDGNLSRLMQKLTTGYALYYNRRHGRHGHLFDGRYKAKVVEGDEYLLKGERKGSGLACKYIFGEDKGGVGSFSLCKFFVSVFSVISVVNFSSCSGRMVPPQR